MRNEKHRELCLKAFSQYRNGHLQISSYSIAEIPNGIVPYPSSTPCVYVVRIDKNRASHPEILAIPHAADQSGILYIGGHTANRGAKRFNSLIKACRNLEQYFDDKKYSPNDKSHQHSVARHLTTGLLHAGFRINHCILDIFPANPEVNELELIIGYEETFHRLPPWNSVRGGTSSFADEKS